MIVVAEKQLCDRVDRWCYCILETSVDGRKDRILSL